MQFLEPPSRTQALNRRCAVGTVTPKEGGRCRHAHPLVSTYTISVNTARSSAGALPPPCGRATKGGVNGSTISHSASGTNLSDNSCAVDNPPLTAHRSDAAWPWRYSSVILVRSATSSEEPEMRTRSAPMWHLADCQRAIMIG